MGKEKGGLRGGGKEKEILRKFLSSGVRIKKTDQGEGE